LAGNGEGFRRYKVRSEKTFKILSAVLCAVSFIFLMIAIYIEGTNLLLFIKNHDRYWIYSAIFVTEFVLALSSTILLVIPVFRKDHGMIPFAQGGLVAAGILEILVLILFYGPVDDSFAALVFEGFAPMMMIILAVCIMATRRRMDKKIIILVSVFAFLFFVSSVFTYRISTFFQFAPVLAVAFMINIRTLKNPDEK